MRPKITIPKDLPELAQFFGGYFRPDWPQQYGTVGVAIARYLSDTPKARVREAVTELDWLLGWLDKQNFEDSSISEDPATYVISDILHDNLHLNYYAPDDGQSNKEW